jgi:hypothetical protein
MSQKTKDAMVRYWLRMFADGHNDEPPPDFADLTADELDAAWAEVGRRVSGAMDKFQSRIAELLPHLTPGDWETVDRIIQDAIAPIFGKPPGRRGGPPRL